MSDAPKTFLDELKQQRKPGRPAVIERKVAYVLNDPYYKGLEILKGSSQAWWNDRTKVVALLNCFKNGFPVGDALISVGLTRKNYADFTKIHPNFEQAKYNCLAAHRMMAHAGLTNLLKKEDPATIRWWLERLIPEKYGRNIIVGSTPASRADDYIDVTGYPTEFIREIETMEAKLEKDEKSTKQSD